MDYSATLLAPIKISMTTRLPMPSKVSRREFMYIASLLFIVLEYFNCLPTLIQRGSGISLQKAELEPLHERVLYRRCRKCISLSTLFSIRVCLFKVISILVPFLYLFILFVYWIGILSWYCLPSSAPKEGIIRIEILIEIEGDLEPSHFCQEWLSLLVLW